MRLRTGDCIVFNGQNQRMHILAPDIDHCSEDNFSYQRPGAIVDPRAVYAFAKLLGAPPFKCAVEALIGANGSFCFHVHNPGVIPDFKEHPHAAMSLVDVIIHGYPHAELPPPTDMRPLFDGKQYGALLLGWIFELFLPHSVEVTHEITTLEARWDFRTRKGAGIQPMRQYL